MPPADYSQILHRPMTQGDLDILRPWADEAGYFEEAWQEQGEGKRLVVLAFQGQSLCGFAHYNRFPRYAPFRRLGIPEIQDLFVLPDFRRHGIGAGIVGFCETLARDDKKADIGIGVGVSSKFGSAQRLYARLGFLPDGAGVVFNRDGVRDGEVKPIDNRLCLMLVKSIGN